MKIKEENLPKNITITTKNAVENYLKYKNK